MPGVQEAAFRRDHADRLEQAVIVGDRRRDDAADRVERPGVRVDLGAVDADGALRIASGVVDRDVSRVVGRDRDLDPERASGLKPIEGDAVAIDARGYVPADAFPDRLFRPRPDLVSKCLQIPQPLGCKETLEPPLGYVETEDSRS